MGVGIKVGQIIDEIGSASFLHSFFSTISAHCETEGWGSRFPTLMNRLYQGGVSPQEAVVALTELREAKAVLSQLPPSLVVWDIEDRSLKPPWGADISDEITDLGNYFVSSTGRDVFELLDKSLRAAVEGKKDAVII
jgi:2,3-bisphosphoglycerate-dependent phosphoglycerate mutase